MHLYHLLTYTLTLTILLAYLNHFFIKTQSATAMMGSSFLLSLFFLFAGHWGFPELQTHVAHWISELHFSNLLLDGFLSFLLFAGALQVDLGHLKSVKWEVAVLAAFSTTLSTLLIGFSLHALLPSLGVSLPLLPALLFGALISPTDPIAVLSLFKKIKMPKQLNAMIEGESLFNDGVAIVLFLTLYTLSTEPAAFTLTHALQQLVQLALGGILLGLFLGVSIYYLIKPLHHRALEILMTCIIPTGGYTLAHQLGVSGPLAMVVAGIFLGNQGSLFSVSLSTKEALTLFWSLIDELLNALVFFLMGFELITFEPSAEHLKSIALALGIVLVTRWIVVALPMRCFQMKKSYPPLTTLLLTWGGVRGGLSIALALSLGDIPERTLILGMTYTVVACAMLIQGTTVGKLAQRSQSLSSQREAPLS